MCAVAMVTTQSVLTASPGFFKANWLWLGKTLLELKRRSEAKQWLQKLVDTKIPAHDIDDHEVIINSYLLPPSPPPNLSSISAATLYTPLPPPQAREQAETLLKGL